MGAFDDLIPTATPSGGAFDDLIPSPTPSGTPEGKTWFLPRSGAQMDVEEARQAAQQLPDVPFVQGLGEAGLEALPKSAGEAARMVGEALGGPAVGGIEDIAHTGGQLADLIRGKSLDEVSPPGKPYDQFTGEDWGRLAGQIGLQGIQALPLVGEGLKLPLRAPEPIAASRVPEPPPTVSMGPGTTAADVSNALDWTPQSAPVTPLEEAISKVQPPGPQVSPETGFTIYPGLEDHQPVPSDWAYPVPPPGTPLKGTPLVGPNGSTPAANVAAAQAPQGTGTVRLYHGGAGEQAGSDFTTDLGYAQGYADKTPGGKVWQVDVPQGLLKTHDEYGQPVTRVVVPDHIANQAQLRGDERYAGVTPQMATQEAPIGAANRIASAREEAGLTEAPPSGIGQSWHESVAQGNALIDKGADAYKVVSDFTKTGNISGEKMSVARAWLERLQRANQEARGALEQDPTNPALQQKALDAETAEGAYWQGYQPMKTEWSRIGTGMQESRGITDADLLNQKTAEQTMREAIDRELTESDKVRAAKAVSDTRAANARSDAAFDKAIGEATRKAKGPPRSLEQLKNDLAAKLKELTPC